MTSAGWYPDPAGAPNTYRYWDGHAWSQTTSTDPFGQAQATQPAQPPAPHTPPQPPQPIVPPAPPIVPTPPPAPQPQAQPAPQPPPTYGALPDPPQWSPMPGAPTPAPAGGSASARTIAIASGAVAFVVLLAIIAFVAVRTLGNDDNGAPSANAPIAGDTPTPTEPSIPGIPGIPGTSPTAPLVPSKPLGTVTPTALQCYGGLAGGTGSIPRGSTLSGGRLTVPNPQGYRVLGDASVQFPFATGPQASEKAVSTGWASTLVIGGLPRSSGFTGLEQAARAVLACAANNPLLYTGVTDITDLSARSVTVDGHPAFSLVQDIRVNTPTTTAKGDTAQVVVVDTGNKQSYGVFLMVVPIGDQHYLGLQKSTVAGLRVR
ncbi:MAG TPA: DUF2510 domain-containing protein [Nocardioides sp.]|nr:DUF2510 domain-containing protein [Nocardioides sp.]